MSQSARLEPNSIRQPETSPPRRPSPNHPCGRIRLPWSAVWLIAWLALGGALLLYGRMQRNSAVVPPETIPASLVEQVPVYKPIERIVPGERVQALNPLLPADAVSREPITPATHRLVSLHMRKPTGDTIDIRLIRSLDWIAEQRADVGKTIDLDLAEMEIRGPAEVLAIDHCPSLQAGDGELVTGTFAHSAKAIVDIHLEDGEEPISCTPNHLIYSADREGFVRADSFRAGNQLAAADGGRIRVIAVSARPLSERVYNLEIEGEHVYFVSSSQILVHNLCAAAADRLNALDSLHTDDINSATRDALSSFNANKLHNNLKAKRLLAEGDEAHHIVPSRHKAAEEARAILRKYGININSVDNGISLPHGKHHGHRLHSIDGIEAVTNRLKDAIEGVTDPAAARAAIVNELNAMAAEMRFSQFSIPRVRGT